uniref:RING-type domain-containing protein n=1 Tax=viral metagenome TaxID=1070528 RepID=A0A6C0E8I3_9ZZZZ
MYYIMDVMDMTGGPIYCVCCSYNKPYNIQYILKTNYPSQNKNETIECPICLEDRPYIEIITTNCGHNYCIKCIKEYFVSKKKPYNCAYCRTKIENISIVSKYYYMEFKIYDILCDNNYIDSNFTVRVRYALLMSIFIMIIGLGVFRVS